MQKLTKDNRGFTIIEVLIVLAIAGLIMLIVFLAVPALQRNSRNNGRNNDASRISSAVTECLANRNGNRDLCNSEAEIAAGTLSQLETISFATSGSPSGSTTAAAVRFGARCNEDGSGALVTTGVSSRDFAVRWQIEPSDQQRCIGS